MSILLNGFVKQANLGPVVNLKNITHLTDKDSAFPQAYKYLPQPPKEIFVLGALPTLLEAPGLAIVGARKATSYGRYVTQELASKLAALGINIISGLALGVDSIAHQAALDAGGKTIAVLPTPLEKIYPAAHYHLAKSIIEQGGALLSEYPGSAEVYKENFVARNRLIAALADGVLITEAGLKSGSLHTARFALEQGKVVMAVPGNINNELSIGTNSLIKAGAIPITNTEDVVAALGLSIKKPKQLTIIASSAEEQAILDLLVKGPVHTNELLTDSNLSTAVFNQTLTMLEINGRIRPSGGGHWSLN